MTFDDERGAKPTELNPPAETDAQTVIEDVFDTGEEPETVVEEPLVETVVEPSPPASHSLDANQIVKTVIEEPVEPGDPPEIQEFRTVLTDQQAVGDTTQLSEDDEGNDARVTGRMAAGAAAGVAAGALGGALIGREAIDRLRDQTNEDVASATAAESLDVFERDADAFGPGVVADPTPESPGGQANEITDQTDPSSAAPPPRPGPGEPGETSSEPLFPDPDETADAEANAPDASPGRPPFVPGDNDSPSDVSTSSTTPDASSSSPEPTGPADQIIAESPVTTPFTAAEPDQSPDSPGGSSGDPTSDPGASSDASGSSSPPPDGEPADDPLQFSQPDPPATNDEPIDFTPSDSPDADPGSDADNSGLDGEDGSWISAPPPLISEPVIIQEPPEIDTSFIPDPGDGFSLFDDDDDDWDSE